MIHGKRGTYTYHGCRCRACTAVQAAYMDAYRQALKGTLSDDDSRHGTTNGYDNYACRCLTCTNAKQAGTAAYQARKRAS